MTKELDAAEFWQGPHGNEYVRRNDTPEIVAANKYFFELSLLPTRYLRPTRVIEFGANIGMNIKALRQMEAFSLASYTAVEINRLAAMRLYELPNVTVHRCDMTAEDRPWMTDEGYDVVLCKGVLIHIAPAVLQQAYSAIYDAARQFIFIAEYFAAERRMIEYRGQKDKLWLADYGKEFWQRYPDLKLVDYGFAWKEDKPRGQDDLTWWLFEKGSNLMAV